MNIASSSSRKLPLQAGLALTLLGRGAGHGPKKGESGTVQEGVTPARQISSARQESVDSALRAIARAERVSVKDCKQMLFFAGDKKNHFGKKTQIPRPLGSTHSQTSKTSKKGTHCLTHCFKKI